MTEISKFSTKIMRIFAFQIHKNMIQIHKKPLVFSLPNTEVTFIGILNHISIGKGVSNYKPHLVFVVIHKICDMNQNVQNLHKSKVTP